MEISKIGRGWKVRFFGGNHFPFTEIFLSFGRKCMKPLKFLLFVIAILYITPVCAQQSPEDLCRTFFEKYKSQNSDSALNYLFRTNKFVANYQQQSDEMKLNLRHVVAGSGMYFSNELVSTRTAGKSVALLTFVVNHELQPLIFRISFYKPQTTWQILNITFTTKVEDELEEASRIYRLKENIDF
jgi:hypothetical protein